MSNFLKLTVKIFLKNNGRLFFEKKISQSFSNFMFNGFFENLTASSSKGTKKPACDIIHETILKDQRLHHSKYFLQRGSFIINHKSFFLCYTATTA